MLHEAKKRGVTVAQFNEAVAHGQSWTYVREGSGTIVTLDLPIGNVQVYTTQPIEKFDALGA